MLTICDLLAVSPSGYYAWKSPGFSSRRQRDDELAVLIQEIFRSHKRRYGARRIAKELAHRGETCSVSRVAKLLKTLGLVAIQPKSFKPRTTQSRHRLGYNSNLVKDYGSLSRINEVWVADITYIPLMSHRFGYLSILMDLYSRKIVGWSYSESMTEDLVMESLRLAIKRRRINKPLIHHSDRGGQYAAKVYRAILKRARIQQSMTAEDHCYENAFMESCYGTIKTELELKAYADSRAAFREIGEYIGYYNTRRRHSSLDYLTPTEFEHQQTQPFK